MSTAAPSGRQLQLDGLRAIAMFGVLLAHFPNPLPHALQYGPLGVRFFFILSGYLITRSLMKTREQTAGKSLWKELPSFYVQRYLRIVPPFYFFLAICLLFGLAAAPEIYRWHATFLSNFFISRQGWWPETTPHLWSIAVQEQFYLLWPFFVFFCPRRWLLPGMLVIGASSAAFRLWCLSSQMPELTRWILLPGCLDAFAEGGLLAVILHRIGNQSLHTRFFMLAAAPAITCLLVGQCLRALLPSGSLWFASIAYLEAIFLLWLIAFALHGIPGLPGRLLSSRPLVFLGTISYGMYLYHMLMPALWNYWLPGWKAQSTAFSSSIHFFMMTLATFALSWLSWHWLESPFMKIKGFLGSRKKTPAKPAPASLPSGGLA